MANWQIEDVNWPASVAAAARVFAGGAELAWLDSPVDVAIGLHEARYSLLATNPRARLEQYEGGPARLIVAGEIRAQHGDGWQLWRAVHRRLPNLPTLPMRLGPGWVGYVGFEMARQLERLPADRHEDFGLPLLRMSFYDRVIVLDHQQRRAHAITAPNLLDADTANDDWIARWNIAASESLEFPAPSNVVESHETSAWEHEATVRRALEYIAAGDIYQVNLAHRIRLTGLPDALSTYAALRRGNPAPYAALLCWPDGAVASVSPELFHRVRDGEVLTCPIKGTRPRVADETLNTAYRAELLASAKDAAELAMIVDLHRNDLGRVCAFGSIKVADARRVETHPSVFHTVADVVGRLAPQRDALDLLAASFPAGSITGVPKIRALQIIDELEPVARGVYTGAIGMLGLDGQMTFNVAIRTLQIRGDVGTLYVGGGIVADSDPADEYAETLAKARGILGALTGVPATGAAAK